MNTAKTKSLRDIEEKMKQIDEKSLRYQVLESAKNFKTSWMDLGRAIYPVWKDKLYRQWGYNTFDSYTARELGIRKQTAMKLLRSYYFLEKEEPSCLKKDYREDTDAVSIPSFESVDVLRLAKGKRILDEEDYVNLKRDVFEKGKDATELRKNLTTLIKERQDLDPVEVHKKRKLATVKRFIAILKSLKNEVEISKLVSASIIKDADNLIKKLEDQIQ